MAFWTLKRLSQSIPSISRQVGQVTDFVRSGKTTQSKVMAMEKTIAAEIERTGARRDLIAKRTRQALAVRKAAGMKLGRPKGGASCGLSSIMKLW